MITSSAIHFVAEFGHFGFQNLQILFASAAAKSCGLTIPFKTLLAAILSRRWFFIVIIIATTMDGGLYTMAQ